MLMFKRNPINDNEYAHFLEWEKLLGERIDRNKGYHRGIEWMYLPQDKKNNYWTDVIVTKNIYDVGDINRDLHNMSTITDDKPFPYDVYTEREAQWEVFKTTTILSLAMVLLPALATFLSRREGSAALRSKGFDRVATNILLILYFAILGIAYLLIEIVLMQKFQMFLSSPIYSLVVVLGTMLVASGIGGYLSGKITKKGALGALLAVVAITAVYWAAIEPVLGALMFLPFLLRILAAVVLIAPLAFFMGMPFPYAMNISKMKLSDGHAGLFFGVNGALAAMASPLSIILSMTKGFNFTIMIGGAAYLVCLLILAGVRAPAQSSK